MNKLLEIKKLSLFFNKRALPFGELRVNLARGRQVEQESTQGDRILKDISVKINSGEIHAIMGPNGSGKSSLAYTLMGHPSYVIKTGSVSFLGKNIVGLSPDKRAKLGLFLAFQYPHEVSGATVFSVLKELYVTKIGKLVTITKFSMLLFEYMDLLQIDRNFAHRSLNEGFSGGEKKKFEILQLLILQPKLAILDEIDSGLDIDALRIVAQGILYAKEQNPTMGILLITHYQRILNYITPDYVHVMHNGEIKKTGDFLLAKNLEQHGYSELVNG